jgi:hypothetical protein
MNYRHKKIIDMKKFVFSIAILLLIFAGCDREFENDVISITPPELHVVVRDSNVARVEGAQVELFNTQAAYDSRTGAIASKTTGSDGKAVFTKEELRDPGMFYVAVSKDGETNAGTEFRTPFLLLTDGHTHFFVTIQ